MLLRHVCTFIRAVITRNDLIVQRLLGYSKSHCRLYHLHLHIIVTIALSPLHHHRHMANAIVFVLWL